MDTDLILVIGILLSALAIPSLLSAYSETRVPRAGAIMILVGGVLVMVALTQRPTGYRIDDIPSVIKETCQARRADL
jgi:hypothetical protein